MKLISFHISIIQRLASLLTMTSFGISLAAATAQEPRLNISLDYPSALSSVGSVLAASNGNIVVNHDGFGGYQDGAVFVLDSDGNLLSRIPAIEISANRGPFWLAPTVRAILPGGNLIVDYVTERDRAGLLRLRLNPDGVALFPWNDAHLPSGPLTVQPNGGLVIAPPSEGRDAPLTRFAENGLNDGPRGFLLNDPWFDAEVRLTSSGQSCIGLASGTNGEIWAWLVDNPRTTNSIARLTRFLPDGRLDPEFNQSTAPKVRLTDSWEPWIGPLPDGRAFVLLPPEPPAPELGGAVVKRLHPDGSIDARFLTATLSTVCPGDGFRSWGSILTPLADGGIFVPAECSFVRLRADGTSDVVWNEAHTSFRSFEDMPQQITLQTDGRLLVVHGPSGSRFPRPQLGRLFADGRLDAESFNPPNPFAAPRVPTIAADGLTPGRWYALEHSEILAPSAPGENTWDRLSLFQAPPPDHQPLRIPLPWSVYVPRSEAFWRLKETSAP